MKGEMLRALQAPLKERYRQAPNTAFVTLKAEGRLDEGVSCKVATSKATIEAGLHSATGGTGLQACLATCFAKHWLRVLALRWQQSHPRLASKIPASLESP